MKIYIDPVTGLLEMQVEGKESVLVGESSRAQAFLRRYEECERLRLTGIRQEKQQELLSEKAADKRFRERRINELLSLISYLRQKLAASGYDQKIAGQLSMVQSELFWLMFSI